MHTCTLNPDGLVDRPPKLFVGAIEFTLEHWIVELRWGDWNFPIGAGHLAAEVHGSGLEWSPFASRYREAGVERGMDADEADRILDLAWQWAPFRSAPWIRFTREWILVGATASLYHLISGGSVLRKDFESLFSDALYDAEIAAVFPDYLVDVERVISDPSQPRGFHVVDAALVFNAP